MNSLSCIIHLVLKNYIFNYLGVNWSCGIAYVQYKTLFIMVILWHFIINEIAYNELIKYPQIKERKTTHARNYLIYYFMFS